MYIFLMSFAVLIGLPLHATTKKEEIALEYYQSIQKGNFDVAQKILVACKQDKDCNHFKMMNVALEQAISDKDRTSIDRIDSQLKYELFDKIVRENPMIHVMGALMLVATMGSVIQEYRERH